MHEIKHGIPVPPPSKAGRGKPAIYPFASMKDGDYFDEPLRKGETPEAGVRRMRSCSGSFRARHNSPMSFVVRAFGEKGKIVIRVWAHMTRRPKTKPDFSVEHFFRP